jgi:hypothetical protein
MFSRGALQIMAFAALLFSIVLYALAASQHELPLDGKELLRRACPDYTSYAAIPQ